MKACGKLHIPSISRKEPSRYDKSHIPPALPDASAADRSSECIGLRCLLKMTFGAWKKRKGMSHSRPFIARHTPRRLDRGADQI